MKVKLILTVLVGLIIAPFALGIIGYIIDDGGPSSSDWAGAISFSYGLIVSLFSLVISGPLVWILTKKQQDYQIRIMGYYVPGLMAVTIYLALWILSLLG